MTLAQMRALMGKHAEPDGDEPREPKGKKVRRRAFGKPAAPAAGMGYGGR